MANITDATLHASLQGSMRDYRSIAGSDLVRRVDGFFEWQDARRAHELWPFCRATRAGPRTECAIADDAKRQASGVNFGSQDYLSLADHPEIREAAHEAIDRYGVHSAGSAALMGNTDHSIALERKIAQFLGMEHAVLYPTGYAAGSGAIKGMVRSNDHVVIDALAHTCLQDGAASATKNVTPFRHLDIDAARRVPRRIRAKDTANGILVVTEGLFSMDSDMPDVVALQALCGEYGATLMVDVAHDLGCLGEDGRGCIGMQGMLGKIDIVMGSFSKTFASNGGFVACRSRSLEQYLRYYSTPTTFSNALSPVQAAVALKAFAIVDSTEGSRLRAAMMRNVLMLRERLGRAGLEVYGDPSAIVAVKMGAESVARLVSRALPRLGLIANLVEYPAVPKGAARFRLQAMAGHTAAQIELAALRMKLGLETAVGELEDILGAKGRAVA